MTPAGTGGAADTNKLNGNGGGADGEVGGSDSNGGSRNQIVAYLGTVVDAAGRQWLQRQQHLEGVDASNGTADDSSAFNLTRSGLGSSTLSDTGEYGEGEGEGEGGASDLLAVMNAKLSAGLRTAVDASCRRAWDEYGAQLSLRVATSEIVDCEEENRILGELREEVKEK